LAVSQPLQLAITIDVEEEGLFSGSYPRTPPGVANVSALERLRFIPREFGFPLTLLVAYQVARDPVARRVLTSWREEHGAELGGHLHPWNTPPFWDLADPEPVPCTRLPLALLGAKLATLVSSHQEAFQMSPRSFRMGRFDWCPSFPEILARFGLRVDSTMVPLTQKVGGPTHFLAPVDPFWLHLPGSGLAPLLEVPLTMVPLWPGAPQAVQRFSRRFPEKLGETLRAWFPSLLAAGIHPAWFPLFAMRRAVTLHRRRGGRVLNLFLHSSELHPGGNPKFPTPQSVDRLIAKLRAFLSWLVETGPMAGVTLSGLYQQMRLGC
jgi:hypothetical protein